MARNSIELMGTPDGLYYWIPGEMVVVARLHRHPAADAQEMLIEQIRGQLNALLAGYGITLEPYGSAGRWQDVLLVTPMRRSFIFGRHRQQPLIAIFFHALQLNASEQDAMPMALSYIQSNLEQLAQAGLHIVSAMPNWLVSAAPVLYSSGGPSMPPVPAPEVDVPAASSGLTGWRVSFTDPGLPLHPNGAEDVVVAVLDTALHPERIRAAVTRPELKRNWLLQQLVADLRNENGLFEIEYDRYPIIGDACTGQDFYGEPRYYFMPDHGVFVAGLIRDIASRARIRLIRILNDFGGGDIYNLFAALTDLEQEVISGSIRRLVVNLSLCVMPDIRRLPYIWFDNRQWPSTQLSSAVRVLAHIEEGLRLLFESLHAQGVLIVAAAGNDSLPARKQKQKPRAPRAPARYETTLSVTSVNSRNAASQFANAACMPPLNAGIATFGGDAYGATDAGGLPDAVRGLFISPSFPNGEQNNSGWADWRGTSFSTAIASALGAHLMAQNWSAPQAITRIAAGRERRTDKLYGASPDLPDLLANVIRVKQLYRV
ncbi:MAG TPA: S8/S53 family peptidase [Ktedonobacteraceae bacterium]|nr:S8/S53 family peptidase [Ktedonobacteraceae bacterium]